MSVFQDCRFRLAGSFLFPKKWAGKEVPTDEIPGDVRPLVSRDWWLMSLA